MINKLLDLGANPLSQKVKDAVLEDRDSSRRLIWLLDTSEKIRLGIPKKSFGTRVFEQLCEDRHHTAQLEGLLDSGAFNLNLPEHETPEARGRLLIPLGYMLRRTAKDVVKGTAMVERILRMGADPDGVVEIILGPPRRYHTALMVATDVRNLALADLLINSGADVNKKPYLTVKYTPLQYAAKSGDLDMVKLLLEYGADVKACAAPHGGGTALQLAAGSGNLEIFRTLIDIGAPLDMGPAKVDGRWPLEAAAEGSHLDVIHSLWATKTFFQTDENGFGDWQCLRAMKFAQDIGHLECRDLISGLSGVSVARLETDNYGVSWLVY
jgi:hypothetical protein